MDNSTVRPSVSATQARRLFGEKLENEPESRRFGGTLACSVWYQHDNDIVVLADSHGFLLDREDYLAIISGLQRMYAGNSQADIDEFNECKRLRDEADMRKALTAGREYFEPTRKPKKGYVYLLEGGGHYKIGRAKNPHNRSETIGTQLPYPVTLIHVVECADYEDYERSLHRRFAEKRLHGEWFDLSPEDIAYIQGLPE